jgi:hypothetical protein
MQCGLISCNYISRALIVAEFTATLAAAADAVGYLDRRVTVLLTGIFLGHFHVADSSAQSLFWKFDDI